MGVKYRPQAQCHTLTLGSSRAMPIALARRLAGVPRLMTARWYLTMSSTVSVGASLQKSRSTTSSSICSATPGDSCACGKSARSSTAQSHARWNNDRIVSEPAQPTAPGSVMAEVSASLASAGSSDLASSWTHPRACHGRKGGHVCGRHRMRCYRKRTKRNAMVEEGR